MNTPSCRTSVMSSSSHSSDTPFVTVQVKDTPSTPVRLSPAPSECKKDADSAFVDSNTLDDIDVTEQLVFKNSVSMTFLIRDICAKCMLFEILLKCITDA